MKKIEIMNCLEYCHFDFDLKFKNEKILEAKAKQLLEEKMPLEASSYNYKICAFKEHSYLIVWNKNKLPENKKYFSPLIYLSENYAAFNFIYIDEDYFVLRKKNCECKVFSPESLTEKILELKNDEKNIIFFRNKNSKHLSDVKKICLKEDFIFLEDEMLRNKKAKKFFLTLHKNFDSKKIKFFSFMILIFLLSANFYFVQKINFQNKEIKESKKIITDYKKNLINNKKNLTINEKLRILKFETFSPFLENINISDEKFDLKISGKNVQKYVDELKAENKIKNLIFENYSLDKDKILSAHLSGEFCE